MLRLRSGYRHLPVAIALLVIGCAAEPDVEFPPVRDWPSPNPGASMPARLDRIAQAMGEHPLPVDEIELLDGTRTFAKILREDPYSYSVWIHDGARNHSQNIPRDQVAAIHAADPSNAFLYRLAQLEQIENAIDNPSPVKDRPAVAKAIAGARSGPSDEITWTFEHVGTRADLPGAADIRWWPRQPTRQVSSAIEPFDDPFDRTGIWALLTDGLPRDSAAVLEVRIEAERVSFDHSPGFWGATPDDMYTQWRFLVDGVVRYESPPPADATPDRGRYDYETLSFTLGPGEHVLRWELRGSGRSGVYFWGLDTIRFTGVAQPELQGEWGVLDEA